VKTQAVSIYRKLGASSRSETIVRMQEFGLATHVAGA
jgi:DNA-binding NarL/FixJ family response regulator